MQSTVPDDPSWKNPRFYLWLFAIGAIIYNSITYNNVAILGDFFGFFIYYILATLWYKFSIKYSFSELNPNDPVKKPTTDPEKNKWKTVIIVLINVLLTISIFIASLWAIGNMMGVIGGVIVTSVLFLSLFAVIIYMSRMEGDGPNAGMMFDLYKSAMFAIFNFDYAALSVLFPISLIYTEINKTNAAYDDAVKNAKTQTTNPKPIPSPIGQQIVYGSALSMLMITLLAYWWKFRTTIQLDKPISLDDRASWLNILPLNFLKAFPLIEYAKYVLNSDYTDVAKRVTTLGLLAYVAYLMFSVYIKKQPLTPCADSLFSTCFKSPFPITTDVPYVNLLFWTLILCSIINVVNWIINFVTKNALSSWVSSSSPPADIATFIRLALFPFYWVFSMFAQHPVAATLAFMAFAALGLLLYRSSFDITAFMQGQRGTVITLFAMFIASLAIFGAYSMNSSASAAQGNDVSYGQFIGKTGMAIAIAVCVVGLIMYFLNTHSKLVSIANVVQYGVTALIYIAGIAIAIGVVRTLFSTSRKMGGSIFQVSRDPESNWVINMLKLLANLLFYLPCLMLDFVDTMKEQYGLTTRPMLILLAMEALFILVGRFLPSAVAKAINHTGVQILSAPISMTAAIPITTHDIQFVDAHGVNEIPSAAANGNALAVPVLLKNYSYGVSAWFYIHPQPPSTNANYDSYINMMQLGEFGPSVQYNPKTNALQFSLYGKTVELSKNDALTVTDIPLQTWNNVIINSDKGALDIFINNKLVYTGNHVPSDNTNANAQFNVTVGHSDGVHGEICNMVLNTAPFSKTEIAWLYKTNKTLNPPVVGVSMDPQNQGDSASYLATEAVDANAPKPTPMPTYSGSGMLRYGIICAVLGAIFGWLFNNDTTAESVKGFFMGAIVFGLIGALLGALFSTDGTVAYILKSVANVFVDTF